MKVNNISYFIGLFTLAFTAQPSQAQNAADSTKRPFNALDYRLQKRYIPQGKVIDKDHPGESFSISIMGGFTKTEGETQLPMIYNGGIFVSKDVSAFNTYRLGYIGGFNKNYSSHGIELSHLFALSDYLGGFRPQSRVNLSTVWGIGGYRTQLKDEKAQFAAGLHAGLHAVYRISKHFDWYIEPKLYVLTDYMDGETNHKNFDFACGVLTGITYRLAPLSIKGKSENAGDNMFIEAGVGVQGDFVESNRSSMSKAKLIGPSVSVSLGKWFMPLGVRATLFGGMHYTAYPTNGIRRKEAYVGERLEGLINLNTLFNPSATDPKWEFNVAGGYEFGLLAHRGEIYKSKVRGFHGPTGAAQIVYFVNGQYGIFVEGRYSKSFYKQSMTSGSIEKRHQQNWNGMIGIQYRRRKEDYDQKSNTFHPYNFAYGSLGANYPVQITGMTLKKVFENVGGQLNAGLGHQFTPESGMRVGLEVGYYRDGDHFPVSINADYMLNATNLIDGYNPNRVFDAYGFFGMVGMYNHTSDRNFFFGLEGGFQESFKLDGDDKWSFYLEEGAQLFNKTVTSNVKPFTNHGHSVVLKASVGVKYRF